MNIMKILAAALVPLCCSIAHADPSYSGTSYAAWSNPILGGAILDPATGELNIENYSDTAACNLSGCPYAIPGYDISSLAWGDAGQPPSSVIFTPASFSNVLPGQLFQLGTLTYTNSVSYSVIFGATLGVGINLVGSNSVVSPFIVDLGISTTSNDGTEAQNADFLNFNKSLAGSTTPVTFNVYEGSTATAILWGSIIGDPQLVASSLTLAPGSEAGGFIGSGIPAVPEPSTAALMLMGIAGAATALRRQRTGRG